MRTLIVILLCALQILLPACWLSFGGKAYADSFLDSATQGQSMGMNLLNQASHMPSLKSGTPSSTQQSNSSTLYMQDLAPGQQDTSKLQGYFARPENMEQGSINNYNTSLQDPNSALSTISAAQYNNPPPDLSSDSSVLQMLQNTQAASDGSEADAASLFGGCDVEQTTSPAQTQTVHVPQIYTCHGIYTSLPGCTFSRSLQFQYVATQTILTITSSSGTLSGTFPLSSAGMGIAKTWTGTQPDGSAVTFQATPFQASSTKAFVYNDRIVVTGGTSSGSITSYGTPADNWTLQGTVKVSGASSITVVADLYNVTQNSISGCGDYLPRSADGWCKTSVQCTDERGPCTTVDGISFCTNSGPAAGIADLIDSANGVVDPLCWAGQGEPATCSYTTGSVPCYTDAEGDVLCGSASTAGMTSSSAFPGGEDDCALKGLSTNPSCKMVGVQCTEGGTGPVSGRCYVATIKYDCGQDITYQAPPSTSTSEKCSAAIRCMGTECHNPAGETNTDFSKAAAAASAIQMMQSDMSCAETGQPPTSTTTQCTPVVFGGQQYSCKDVIGSSVGISPDCCAAGADAAKGVSVVNYLKLAYYGSKLAQNPAFLSAVSNIPGYSGFISAFQPVESLYQTGVTATEKMLVDPVVNGMEHLGFKTLDQAGEAAVKKAAQGGIESAAQQMVMQQMNSWLQDAGMKDLAGMIFKNINGTLVLNGAISAALGIISAAYTVYSIMQILMNMIFPCEQEELELGVNRKIGDCHYVGDYCASSVLGVCIETKSSYCCYKTPLARIIMEQARQQLGGYGSPKHPSCGGLTPQEMSQIDWSKIDLSEWQARLESAGILNQTTQWPNIPGSQLEYGINPPGPDGEVDKASVLQARYDNKTSVIDQSRNTLAKSQTCYSNPQYMPWYSSLPVDPEEVIVPVGGEGTVQSCGTGCLDLYMGKAVYNSLPGNGCSPAYENEYSFVVHRPDLITSVKLIDAAWDDHIQILVGGQLVFQSPTFPPETSGDCELHTHWCIGNPPAGAGCEVNAGSPFDVTSIFQTQTNVEIKTRVTVGGMGMSYVHFRITYQQPDPTPSGTACYSP